MKSDYVQKAVTTSMYVIFAPEVHCTIEALYTNLVVLLSCNNRDCNSSDCNNSDCNSSDGNSSDS